MLQKKRPKIVSTAMANSEEVDDLVEVLKQILVMNLLYCNALVIILQS